MADMASSAKHLASDAQERVAAAADLGLNAFKPLLSFQVMMLRMWADSIEKLASNYEKGADEVATGSSRLAESTPRKAAA
jgi:hypothetical protein